MDYAATTPLDSQVKKVMEPYWEKDFGNPSALYSLGRRAKRVLEDKRKEVAEILAANPEEIIFTGSGTESDNLAILGIARANKGNGRHIITSKTEHRAVLEPCQKLEKEGFEVTYLDVNQYGLVNLNDFKKAIRPDTILVSIMYVNNEIGTIQPISKIYDAIKNFRNINSKQIQNSTTAPPNHPVKETDYITKFKIYEKTPFFHTDACQVAGYLDLDVKKLGVDLMSINGSKIYGPKGVGILYKKRGLKIEPLIYGGGQENRLRSGTENIPAIVGFVEALKIAQKERIRESRRLTKLRDYFTGEILKRIPKVVLNGHSIKRLPNNVNISILDIEGEAALLYLDRYGICASTGSACTSETLDPSHVILAMGRPYEYAHGSLRFTLGRETSKKDIDYVLGVLPKVIAKLRKISPLNLKLKSN